MFFRRVIRYSFFLFPPPGLPPTSIGFSEYRVYRFFFSVPNRTMWYRWIGKNTRQKRYCLYTQTVQSKIQPFYFSNNPCRGSGQTSSRSLNLNQLMNNSKTVFTFSYTSYIRKNKYWIIFTCVIYSTFSPDHILFPMLFQIVN